MTTCDRETLALLPEYVYRRLPAPEMERVRQHLGACPACAAAYEAEHALSRIGRGAEETAPPHLFATVMQVVRAEPRQVPAFRVRPLDLLLAALATLALFGTLLGFEALRPLGLSGDTVRAGGVALLANPGMQAAVQVILWTAISLVGLLLVAVSVRVTQRRV